MSLKKHEDRQGRIAPENGGCIFCHAVPQNVGNKGYSMTYHANFHMSCLFYKLQQNDKVAERIAREYKIIQRGH